MMDHDPHGLVAVSLVNTTRFSATVSPKLPMTGQTPDRYSMSVAGPYSM